MSPETAMWFKGTGTQLSYEESVAYNKSRLSSVMLSGQPFEVKDLDLSDRMEYTLPIGDNLSLNDAFKVTHLAFVHEGFLMPVMVYTVRDVITTTLSGRSIRFELELDTVATATINVTGSTAVWGTWDSFPNNLGADIIPFDDVLEIDRSASVNLPVSQYTLRAVTPNVDRTVTAPLVHVFVTGVKDGAFWTYWAACLADLDLNANTNTYLRVGAQASVLGFKPFPTLSQLINEPDRFTPFAAEGSITGISVSLTAPFPVTATVTGQGSADARIELTFDGSGWLIHRNEEEQTAYDTIMIGIPNTLELSDRVPIPSSVDILTKAACMAMIEVRDMTGNIVGSIDNRWLYESTSGNYCNLSGLYYETALSYTGIECRIILPDGSVIKIPQGTLPYNTNAYIDYMATMARYDREILDITQDRALANLGISTANSITNGVLSAALSGNVGVGIASGVVSSAANAAQYAVDMEANIRQLEAKKQQIQLIPDNAYTSTSEFYLSNAITKFSKGHFLPAHMIVVRFPRGSMRTVSGRREWTDAYRYWFSTEGFHAGGRYAELNQDVLTENPEGLTKLRGIHTMSALLPQSGSEIHLNLPLWLENRLIETLKRGVRINLINIEVST